MFRLNRSLLLLSKYNHQRISLCTDASKQQKIEELIKRSQQMDNMTTTQKFIKWLSKNRQQLMNTVMVSLTFFL